MFSLPCAQRQITQEYPLQIPEEFPVDDSSLSLDCPLLSCECCENRLNELEDRISKLETKINTSE